MRLLTSNKYHVLKDNFIKKGSMMRKHLLIIKRFIKFGESLSIKAFKRLVENVIETYILEVKDIKEVF